MMRKIPVLVLALLSTSPVVADSLKDSERMLCVPGSVDHCVSGVACSSELPENENIPEFIEVDLKKKTIAATKASGEDRSTPINSLSREEGYIFIQGMEYGRTFSMVISESTGDLTFVIAANGESATMFGGCTPD
jgi:hypothetical protein